MKPERIPILPVTVLLLIGVILSPVQGLPADSPAPTVRLKESVEVAHGPLSLDDVILGNLENTDFSLRLGSLPEPGSVKFVSRAYVMMMAQNADKSVPSFAGETVRTRVKRPSRTVKGSELRDRITSVVRGKLADGANLQIKIRHVPETLKILPGPFDLKAESPGAYQSERGPVWYRFTIEQKGETTKDFRTKVLVTQHRKVPVAVRRLERGTVVQPDMIDWTKRKIGRLRGGVVGEPEQIIGYELTRNVRADKILKADYLRKPIVIERRDRVTIRYDMNGMTITTDGEAQEKGAVGDRIKVKNTSSEEELSAEVINEGLVEVNRATGKEGNN